MTEIFDVIFYEYDVQVGDESFVNLFQATILAQAWLLEDRARAVKIIRVEKENE